MRVCLSDARVCLSDVCAMCVWVCMSEWGVITERMQACLDSNVSLSSVSVLNGMNAGHKHMETEL